MQGEQIRQEAHALIDTMPSFQVAAVVSLLHSMLDPVNQALANAPWDDEPESEAERLEVAEQDRWLATHPDDTIDHADVLAEFGLVPAEDTATGRGEVILQPTPGGTFATEDATLVRS